MHVFAMRQSRRFHYPDQNKSFMAIYFFIIITRAVKMCKDTQTRTVTFGFIIFQFQNNIHAEQLDFCTMQPNAQQSFLQQTTTSGWQCGESSKAGELWQRSELTLLFVHYNKSILLEESIHSRHLKCPHQRQTHSGLPLLCVAFLNLVSSTRLDLTLL